MESKSWVSPIATLYPQISTSRNGCVTAASYTEVEEEYERIRRGIGLVDYSYYGKFLLQGPGGLDLANRVCMSNVERLPIKKMMPTFMLNADGSVFCDVIVVNQGDSYFLLTEGIEPQAALNVLQREQENIDDATNVIDATQEVALIGLDGPFSWELAKDLLGMKIIGARYLDVITDQQLNDIALTVYRAGKTGEFGYWLQVDTHQATELWQFLLEEGRNYHLIPCGYECIDLCKLENRFINAEREGHIANNVLELNTRIMVDPQKQAYIGFDAVQDHEVEKRLVGLCVESDGVVPDIGAQIQYRGTPIGTVANAAYSYMLKKTVAVAFIDEAYAYSGLSAYELKTGDQVYPIKTISAPFIFNRSLQVHPQEDSYFDEN